MSSILEKSPKYIPALVNQMMRVGERTGRLDEALMSVANFYQEETTRKIDSLVGIIEPILIVVLGALIAGLMISIVVNARVRNPLGAGRAGYGQMRGSETLCERVERVGRGV